MRNKFALVVCCLLVTAPMFALNAGQKLLLDPDNLSRDQSTQFAPKLYDVNRDVLLVQGANGQYLPKRVYAVYDTKQKAWLYALTNSHGHFAIPEERIMAGTILRGSALGATNPYQRYELDKNWKWMPTNDPEQYIFWIRTSPAKIKRVTFLEPYSPKN